MSMETKQEEKIDLSDLPVEWQILIRATQSLVSKARNGADVEIYRNSYSFTINTKRSFLGVRYDTTRKVLEVVWEKYRINDGQKDTAFVKMIERRVEREEDALKLISTIYERILTHIKYKSNTSVIFQDFHYLCKMFEEEEAKQ